MSCPLCNQPAPAAINPRGIIKKILRNNPALMSRKRRDIYFESDYNGKRLLNDEVSKLYDTAYILSHKALAEIIITIVAVIDKMIVLKVCGWRMEDLHEQLEAGLLYRYNITLKTAVSREQHS